ncbi:MAG: DUF1819 domain-containing protein [Deltaproteobacteria bacterium]|nr:DUF1819 domain-containing protein [Deltaproteobacteria bacterium]
MSPESTPQPAEVTELHARILRLALGVEESRSYWQHVEPAVPRTQRAMQAFEQRWFGSKSLYRVRFILANFAERYDAFPDALAALRRWTNMDAPTRQLVCHWHLQLSDPMYRRFTSTFLVERRAMREPRVDRDVVLRWVKSEYPDKWAEATYVQYAQKLLSAASEAGLISPRRDPRTFPFPKVTDLALAYLLRVLQQTRFEGTHLDNPYLRSVGLTDAFLDQRLSKLDGLEYRRMGALFEFHWARPTLSAWAEATLSPLVVAPLQQGEHGDASQ